MQIHTGPSITSQASVSPLVILQLSVDPTVWNMATVETFPPPGTPTSGVIFPFPFGTPVFCGP